MVVHAPSSRRRKGTDHVLEACDGLDVELRIVEGLHHDEALARYRDADIVVDQLNAGWYGLFAIECMALGKPVVTYLHDEAVRRTEEAYDLSVPIVRATAATLRDRLEELVEMGPAGREEIGQASRAYVEQVHDLERVTDRLVGLYETVLEPSRAKRAPSVAPAGPPTDLPPALPLGDTALEATAPDVEVPAADGWPKRRRASAGSSAASAATPRSTGSAGSSRGSSPCSCSRSTRATSHPTTTGRSRRSSPSRR